MFQYENDPIYNANSTFDLIVSNGMYIIYWPDIIIV